MNPISLVLASNSPRRQEYLRWLGLPFVVRTEALEESVYPGETPEAMVARLARTKAAAVPLVDGELVIAADTIVVLEGEVLGKPRGPADARRMLAALRGRGHLVHTALALRPGSAELSPTEIWTETVSARVHMRAYNPAELEAYVASGRPMDKAGAYGIQDLPFAPVEQVEGCYMTVVGLPLCHLARALLRRGIPVPRLPPDDCRSVLGYPCPVALFPGDYGNCPKRKVAV